MPYSWYVESDVLDRERERLFAHAWQYAGHTGQLAEPGSYFTLRAGDVPLVVVRDREGELAAFVNVCRHRGADDDFDRSELGLRRAQVETWGPFVFVNADADAAPLSDTLGDLPELVRDGGIDVDALAFHSRAPYSLGGNWKVAVENFLECYHCQVAHPGFSDVVDVSPDSYRLEHHPTFASHYARLRDGDGMDGQFHLIWPNIKVNVMPGEPNLSIGPLVPVDAGRTDGFLDYFFPPDVDQAWIAEYIELDDQVGAEDRVLVESVQRGLRSRAFERGRLVLPSEDLIADFQRWVAAGLR